MMKSFDLIEALGQLPAPEYPAEKQTAKRSKVKARVLLVAAVIGVLCLSAAAVHLNRTTDLLSEGWVTNDGNAQMAPENVKVFEDYTNELNLAVTDNGTTVVLESATGFRSDDGSQVFFTFTVVPQAGTAPFETEKELGFVMCTLTERDPAQHSYAAGFRTLSCDNRDGTYTMVLAYDSDADIESTLGTLTLTDFGDMRKETMASRWDGNDVGDVKGTWSFELPTLRYMPLTELDTQALDPDILGIRVKKLTVCGLGGVMQLDNSMEELDAFAMKNGGDLLGSDVLTLQLADGSTYPAVIYQTQSRDKHTTVVQYTFEIPQDLTKAEALIFDGIAVTLH